MVDSKSQVNILSKYLIDRDITNEHVYQLYDTAVSNAQSEEMRLLDFAFTHTWALPYLDAALVFLRPESELRRRIYTLFAILESTPEYADLFLPTRFGFWKTIGIFLAGIRAIFRMIVGVIILKADRL